MERSNSSTYRCTGRTFYTQAFPGIRMTWTAITVAHIIAIYSPITNLARDYAMTSEPNVDTLTLSGHWIADTIIIASTLLGTSETVGSVQTNFLTSKLQNLFIMLVYLTSISFLI